jgi:hypothetical protein
MSAARVYGSSPLKRQRRSKATLDALREALRDTVKEVAPATVRQVYYQAVSRGLIEKTEQAYKGIVRLLTQMRRDGQLPFSWLADNTRWMRKPDSYGGIGHLLRDTARLYRRSVWDDQPVYVEIWLEKDALSGVLYDVTEEYDVPLMVTRGYPSLTFLHGAAEAIGSVGKPVHLYYFGDLDPSGIDIPRKVEAGIREFAPKADVHFQRMAVTEQQVRTFNLPTRPTKKSDSRSKSFKGESVEVDALPPDVLRAMCRECIEQNIDDQALEVLREAEASERHYLHKLAAAVGGDR